MSDEELMALMGDALREGLDEARRELGMLMLKRAAGSMVDGGEMQRLMRMLKVGYPMCDDALSHWKSPRLEPWLDFFKENP